VSRTETRAVDAEAQAVGGDEGTIQIAEAAAHGLPARDVPHELEDQLRRRAAQREVFGRGIGKLLVLEQQRGLGPLQRDQQQLANVEREGLLECVIR